MNDTLYIHSLWEDSEFNAFLISLGPKLMNKKVIAMLRLFSQIVMDAPDIKHSEFPGSMSITRKWLRAKLGQSQADKFSQGDHPLNSYLELNEYGSGAKGYSHAYKLTIKGEQLRERIKTVSLSENRCNWRKYGTYNYREKTLYSDPAHPRKLPQDYSLMQPCYITDKAQEDNEVQFQILAHSEYFTGNSFNQYYRKIDNGRLYAKGFTLQTIKKDLRNRITSDQWSSDIQSSAPTMMYQLYQKNNSSRLLGLEDYVRDRSSFREELASSLGVSKNLIKGILIPFFFGGGAIFEGCKSSLDIQEELNCTSSDAHSLLLELKNQPKYKQLASDVRTLFNQINTDDVPNKIVGRNKRVAFLYQMKESIVLDHIMNFELGGNILMKDQTSLLLHDGWITQCPLDIVSLENYLLKETGFSLKVDINYIDI